MSCILIVNQTGYTMKLIKLFIVLLIVISCDSNKNEIESKSACNVENPVEDLTWLKAEIDNRVQNPTDFTKYESILQGEYNGENVFIFTNCCPHCNTIIPIYNCEGEQIGYMGDGNFDSDSVKKTIIIWKPSNSVCN